jgi:DNA-binding NarL/FixJ family response regulator
MPLPRSSKGRCDDLTRLDRDLPRFRPGRAPAPPRIRVLVAESAGLVRAGLRSLLEREPDIAVVAEASTGEVAVQRALEVRPDVVLMDIALDGLGALGATRRLIAQAEPDPSWVKVVIVTGDESEEDLYGALRAGASGFVFLEADPLELLLTVRAVATGGAQLSPWATGRLIEDFASGPSPQRVSAAVFDELTTRERDIASLVALGLTNGEIARRLFVSPATVKTHVSRAMMKLHVRDRAKLVVLAYQSGFVRHDRAAEEGAALDRGPAPLVAT